MTCCHFTSEVWLSVKCVKNSGKVVLCAINIEILRKFSFENVSKLSLN